jgi:type IV pilus assembly protein PilP
MMKPAYFLVAALALAGCSPRDTELSQFIKQTKQEQPGGVEPLPEVRPYESFFYADANLRSPFVPGGNGESSTPGVRPDAKRNRQFLEQFSLDTLSMVGTLRMGSRQFGLIRTSDGLVHRVVPGDYLGQNDGRITAIEPSRINVTEIVPDGLGGYMERTASIALNE